MNPIVSVLSKEEAFSKLAEEVRNSTSSYVGISSFSLIPILTGYLSITLKVPIALVIDDEESAIKVANDIRSIFDIDTTYLPYDPIDKESNWKRASLAGGFVRGEFSVLVGTPESIKNFPAVGISLIITKESKWDYIVNRLIDFGYKRVFMVEKRGEFSIRGGIIDIYPVNLNHPIRLDFFGDEIASIKRFNTLTQRSTGEMELPISIVPVNPVEVKTKVEEVLPPETLFITYSSSFDISTRKLRIDSGDDIKGETPQSFSGDIERIKGYIERAIDNDYNVYIYTVQAKRLQSIIKKWKKLSFYKKKLSSGIVLHSPRIVILSDKELFNFEFAPVFSSPIEGRRELPFEIGDYVVHPYHGIGRFAGLETHFIEKTPREFIVLEFAENDRLLVPVEQAGRLDKYRSFDDTPPPIYRLKSPEWTRIRNRVENDVKDVAKSLIEINAKREVMPGISFKPYPEIEKLLEESFPYEETPDQKDIIEKVKKSMERPRPMDFLVCGDPGYGKTEVAIRAAFRAVLNGKQVAFLVPTTILAHQHYETFRERFATFPVNIAILSRFIPAREVRRIKEGIRDGSIDIVIGTHMILGKDIKFKDLGLLIIDEEHKFGVEQKEKLKELFPLIDVLTLSATPIPRTLSMSLYGLKEIGIIETPPEGRIPITTYVGEYDEKIVRSAIERELARDGQIFYIHPRISGVKELEFKLKNMFPDLSIDILYGTMDEEEIEEKFWKFYKGETKILISTAIIESGIDIPNANTLIIEEGERFGLAQLYQLRGRIGRSGKRAYAYIFHSRQLTPEGEERLRAIYENSILGSGFNIAMRDLEIRGLGNLLGKEQHGHIIAVGFDMYLKMLEDAVRELRGEPVKWRIEPTIVEISIPAIIPDSYIQPPYKLEIYRRLSLASSKEEIEEIREELIDRFGKIPKEVENLLNVTIVRILAERKNIKKLSITDDKILIVLRDINTNGSSIKKLERFGQLKRINDENWVIRWWEDKSKKLLKIKEALSLG
ncbi:transcription-repair coupling factor [bacterium]|nr:transcription-repair coupling factor [bacterium]